MVWQRFLIAWFFLALVGIIPTGWAHVPTGKRDTEHRLVKMAAATAPAVEAAREMTFTYDWRGRRTSKTVWTNWNAVTGSFTLSNTVRFVWDNWRLVAELDATQNPGPPTLLRSYLWGADASETVDGAAGVGGLVAFTDHAAGGGTWFTLTDGRGNVSALANATTGEVEGRLEYGPFGELLRAGGAAARLPLRWSTKFEDGESGLIYYGRRYYDPATGRWLSRDPIGEEGGVNVYGFVGNDPVNRADPVGEADRSRPLIYRNDPGSVTQQFPRTRESYPTIQVEPLELDPTRTPPSLALPELKAECRTRIYLYRPAARRQPTLGERNNAFAFGLPELVDSDLGLSLLSANTDGIISAPGMELVMAKALAAGARLVNCARVRNVPTLARAAGESEELLPYLGELAEEQSRLMELWPEQMRALVESGEVLAMASEGATHWANPKTLADHFARHGADFAAKTADDYARAASDFFRRSQAERLPTKIAPDGTIRVYDPKNNVFGSYNASGTTKTFYKPDPVQHKLPSNLDYWNKQPGVAPWAP